MKRWWIILLVGAAVITLLVVGVFGVIGVVGPDTKVVTGARVKPWHRNAIQRVCKLDPGERILMFYSAAMLSVSSEGNLLTDRAVYSWEEDQDGKVVVSRATFAEIANVETNFKTGWLDDSVISITTTSEDEFDLIAATEAGGDRKLHRKLVELWHQAGGKPAVEGQPPGP